MPDKFGWDNNFGNSRPPRRVGKWGAIGERLAHTDACIDCDGAGRYPSGAACKSCGGSGRVLPGDGIAALPQDE
jgi:hypothetical protein